MERDSYLLKQYGQAVQFLPPRLRAHAMSVDNKTKIAAREFRLRSGEMPTILTTHLEIPFGSDTRVRHEELSAVVDISTGGSVHSSSEQIRAGYLTVSGGHRVGLCGTGVYKNAEVSFIKNISSVAIRIAKEFIGVSNNVYNELIKNDGYKNTIIISPPGCGKTTMLRDLIRNLSDSSFGYRVSVADERSEIAGKYRGHSQFNLGSHTDVMEGMPKAVATMMLLKSMSPDILAVDEITELADVDAIEATANCGVNLLATAHGNGVESLLCRPIYRRLMDSNIFKYAVLLDLKEGHYTARVETL